MQMCVILTYFHINLLTVQNCIDFDCFCLLYNVSDGMALLECTTAVGMGHEIAKTAMLLKAILHTSNGYIK